MRGAKLVLFILTFSGGAQVAQLVELAPREPMPSSADSDRNLSIFRLPPMFPASFAAGQRAVPSSRTLALRADAALVVDQESGRILFAKNPDLVRPIASITKLMTALVVLEAGQPLTEKLTVDEADRDTLRFTRSRLQTGATLTRAELLRLALMSSENRAAAALARNYPGGTGACVAAMNRRAAALGMTDTRFADPTGLSSENVSTARDLAKLVHDGYHHDPIPEFTTTESYTVSWGSRGRQRQFHNTNALVCDPTWSIGLSKTGYISEAGPCLVMQAWIAGRPYIITLLDAVGKYTRTADARRVRRWLETQSGRARVG